ncbi:MAG: type III pantothenate kinase [Candidatus Margulisbacteria bacterium]|nr:type III pantothenate kinase [Candidatus Margulisiibacteriota bacterium]
MVKFPHMLLAIDIGNSNAVFGLFEGNKLVQVWRCETSQLKIPRIKNKIDKVIIASVVPSIDQGFKAKIIKQFSVIPYFVTAQNIPIIKIKLKKLKEIGADRVVDALAAYKIYGGPVIVVDFGTATTFDVITAKGEYLGGAIAPGITMARDALHAKTAKLPQIELKAPKRVIGNDTVSAMQSGLVYGYAGMVEGMVGKIKSQIPNPKSQIIQKSKIQNTKIIVIATGGLAPLVCKYTTVIDRIDTELTLKGLRIIKDALAF